VQGLRALRAGGSPAGRRGRPVAFGWPILFALLWPLPGGGAPGAQVPAPGERVTVRTGTALRGTPDGEVIGVSRRAITAPVESVQGTFVRLTLDGHLAAGNVRFTADRSRGDVSGASGATLRAAASASGEPVAELRRGTSVFPMRAGGTFPAGRTVTFVQVRRSLWVDVSLLTERPVASETPAMPSSALPSEAAPAPVPAASPASLLLETRAPATLRAGPAGDALATLPGGVVVASLGRQDGWVRVRLEGWVPDSAVDALGARVAGGLSAADLRADPTGTVGRIVRWRVEALAVQTADGLRRGLARGERYLLARGPETERAVLYLALPDALVPVAQALRPLETVHVAARVRAGRSEPSGVPILDVLELTRP
jgi:hypothetical protein